MRCYTCNAVLGHLYDEHTKRVADGMSAASSLDKANVRRMCCRRMFLGHVALALDTRQAANRDLVVGEGAFAVRLCGKVDFEREVACN